MTLGELCATAGVPTKWVLNGRTLWGGPRAYSLALARHLTITHELHTTVGMPVPLAFRVAHHALAMLDAVPLPPDVPVLVPVHADALSCVAVNLARILAAVAARSAAWHAGYGARVAGRPRGTGEPSTADAVARAAAWGLDLTLLDANRRRSPAERLRQLDGMVAFRRRVRRVPTATA